MKLIRAQVLLAAFTLQFGLVRPVCGQNTLTNGLLAYYLFDGNANDSSGNGNNGTNNGGAYYVTDRFGNPNAAIYFPGGGIVTTGFTPPIGGASRTFAGWFQVPTTTSQMTMLTYGDPSTAARIELKINSGQFALDTSSGTLWTIPTYDDNNWHYFIVVLNSNTTLGEVLFYLDGELQTNVTSDASNHLINTVGTYPLMLAEAIPPVGGRQLTGALDDIRIYNRALSAYEAAELYEIDSGQTNVPPVITEQPVNTQAALQGLTSFTAAAFSFYPLNYQWQKDGTNLVDEGEFSGATNSELVINPVSANDIGNYAVVVSNPYGNVSSSEVTLTISTNPPTITNQPQSVTITNQGEASFMVGVYSLYPVSYQWQRNGTNLINGGEVSGAATSNLLVSPASLADLGLFRVVVANTYGSVTSTVASLTILTNPPSIITPPKSLTVSNKALASFSVSASSPYSIAYQWQKNGTNLTNGGEISGVSSSNLIVFPAGTNDSGNYQVIVSNFYGALTSSVATLSVVTTSALTNGLLAYYTFNGSPIDASGNGNNGTNIGGSYVQDRFGLPNEAIYLNNAYVGTGFVPPTNHNSRTLSGWFNVSPSSSIQTLLDYGNPAAAEQIDLKITSAGNFSLDISGYTLTSSGAFNDANWHQFIVIIPSNTVLSNVVIYLDDTLQTNLVDSGPAVSIATVGSHPLLMGEYFALGSSLPMNGGLDDVRVYNRALSGAEAQLLYSIESSNPDAAPLFALQPQSATVTNGGLASFNVFASGVSPLAYLWQQNGTNLPNNSEFSGVTTSNLSINPAGPQDTGSFTVVVTNSYGSITSNPALLTVRTLFAWRSIASPQLQGLPFSVTVLAQNLTNGLASNFSGTVALSASGNWRISPTNSTAFTNGVWTGKITVPAATNGLVLSAADALGDTASASAINVNAPPQLGVDFSDGIPLLYWPVVAPTAAVQACTNLSKPTWTAISGEPAQINGLNVFPVYATEPRQFFRIQFGNP